MYVNRLAVQASHLAYTFKSFLLHCTVVWNILEGKFNFGKNFLLLILLIIHISDLSKFSVLFFIFFMMHYCTANHLNKTSETQLS